jgi:hypothetical protein
MTSYDVLPSDGSMRAEIVCVADRKLKMLSVDTNVVLNFYLIVDGYKKGMY